MLTMDIVENLSRIVGRENVLTEEQDLINYRVDHYYETLHPSRCGHPDIVVRPRNTLEVSKVVKLANNLRLPVVPRGAGTGYTGGTVPTKGGIVLDMTKMNKILQINENDFTAVVEAGVYVKDLEETVRPKELTLGHFPGSYLHLTVGGAISADGTGIWLSKYGTIGSCVLDLEVVLPTSEVVKTSPQYKSNLGFNLLKMFIGAEGTLGVITRATLRLSPKPESRMILGFGFKSFRPAYDAAVRILRKGSRPLLYIIEGREALLTSLGMEITGVLLFVGFDGATEEVAVQSEIAASVCEELGGESLGEGAGEAFFNLYVGLGCYLYEKRYDERLSTGKTLGHHDFIETSVNLSRVPEFCSFLKSVLRSHGFQEGYSVAYFYPVCLIVTDANFLFDPTNEDQVKRLRAVDEAISRKALELGGTVTVAHGTGIRHLSRLREVFTPDTLEAMNKIKRALDPNSIMNPGKKFLSD